MHVQSCLKSNRWIVAQIGARRHYAVPAALSEVDALAMLYTDLCATHPLAQTIDRLVPDSIKPKGIRRLIARQIPRVPREKIRCFPWYALTEYLPRSRFGRSAKSYERWLRSNRRFNSHVIRAGIYGCDGVYVFNGAGLEILQRAKSLGLWAIVDQTDAPFPVEELLLCQERERWHNWESGRVERSQWEPMAQRERAEWDLADVIVCGSEYVKNCIAATSGITDRCRVVPYGFGHDGRPIGSRKVSTKSELHVLFAGNLSLQKGVQYFYEAARQLKGRGVRFRAAGSAGVTDEAMCQLAENIELVGTVPRSEMQQQYEWADVLVLPSISEGSANVCYEAIAHGVPVITTPNAGSVIRDEVEGYIVPIRNSALIVERLMQLSEDRDLLHNLSLAASERAKEFTWEKYAQRLTNVLSSFNCESRAMIAAESVAP